MMLAVGGHVLEDFSPMWVRMCTGLAGGVGNTQQEMCGALSSGVMIIGALHGRCDLSESDEPAFRWATAYRQRFGAAVGPIRCALLRERVHATGQPNPCALVVEQAAAILLELLREATP